MKSILRFFIGGIVGIFAASALLNFSEGNFSEEIVVISLIAISMILFVLSIFRFQKIKSLNKQNFSGDEEDEVEDRKYKLCSDYAIYSNISFILSICALSLSLITTQNIIITIVSIIVVIITYSLGHYMAHLMQHVYPERKMIPSTSKSGYAESVLDLADDGEKHVILDGLFKSHSLLNFALIAAIVLSTIYSMRREDPEIFSIILMVVVLLVVNVKYQLVVRNK